MLLLSTSCEGRTHSKGESKWILNKTSETFYSENHYYLLVSLKAIGERPKFYIVPSKVVAEYISRTHSEWLMGYKSDGTAKRDSSIRNFRDPDDTYLEAWHLIDI